MISPTCDKKDAQIKRQLYLNKINTLFRTQIELVNKKFAVSALCFITLVFVILYKQPEQKLFSWALKKYSVIQLTMDYDKQMQVIKWKLLSNSPDHLLQRKENWYHLNNKE